MGDCVIDLIYSFHLCICGQFIHLTIVPKLEWLVTGQVIFVDLVVKCLIHGGHFLMGFNT